MKVSVLVITYNHEKFIEQALESVLMQKTNFEYEIIISEDCSTDKTRDIVLAYKKKYPEKIYLLLSERNLHNNRIVNRGFDTAEGNYIALLDGDDYWSSDEKLKVQAEFLDSHPDCSMCFHNANLIFENEDRTSRWTPSYQKEFSNIEDIWMGNFIATCSVMYRRKLVNKIPEWYVDMFPITDWPLHILFAEQGLIGYINKVMGVYRYHAGGMYSQYSETRKLEETLKFYHTMNKNLNYKYNGTVKKMISKYFIEWAETYHSRGDFKNARKCLNNSLSGRFISEYISLLRLIKIIISLYLPFLNKIKPH